MQPRLFSSRRALRIAFVAQIIMGTWLVGANLVVARSMWFKYGPGSPKSALYGIWDIEQLVIDGQIRSPLINDYDRWRRVLFEFPQSVTFQRMDGSMVWYGATINLQGNTLDMTKSSDKNWKANFTFQRGPEDHLVLDGTMSGHKMHMEAKLVDRNKFLLVSRGFHWIQEVPYNR